MKKVFLSLIIFFMIITGATARTVITTYNNPYITTNDVIDVFLEELNKPRWAHYIYDYEVYNTPEKQNDPWSVEIEDCSYFDDGYNKVAGEMIILNISNGYFVVKTFGGQTTESTKAEGVQVSKNINDGDEAREFFNYFEKALKDFVHKSYKWERVYNKESENCKNTAELCFIYWNSYDLCFKKSDYLYGYLRINKEDLNEEYFSILNNLDGKETYENKAKEIITMSQYSYSLVDDCMDESFDYEDYDVGQYSKFLKGIKCYDIIDAITQRQFIVLEFNIMEKTGGSWENGDVEYNMNTKNCEIPYPIYDCEVIDNYIMMIIQTFLGEDVFCKEILESYNEYWGEE